MSPVKVSFILTTGGGSGSGSDSGSGSGSGSGSAARSAAAGAGATFTIGSGSGDVCGMISSAAVSADVSSTGRTGARQSVADTTSIKQTRKSDVIDKIVFFFIWVSSIPLVGSSLFDASLWKQ